MLIKKFFNQNNIDFRRNKKIWQKEKKKVFSEKAVMIPLKDRKQTTTTKAFEKILNNIGIAKAIYSVQGPEFKNNIFQKLLDKHNICIRLCII